ncbi:cdc25-like protein phosphatase twine [Mya arenaria]|uniref:cdc25-like protein phosphatase twine n=1 Tax=Mya arenaria TaxID=6604 RepID=UPI0022E81E37|nr:cdc25-like protein phosphatase twine [Mya arenaria]
MERERTFKTETSSICSSEPSTLSDMLRLRTPSKPEEIDIGIFLTPPVRGGNTADKDDEWAATDTPTVISGHDRSNIEVCRKPLGRFLSFDVKRSLFSSKRLADDHEDTPVSKRLRETGVALSDLTLDNVETPSGRGDEIKSVVNTLSTDPEVVADGSRPYTIPTIPGKHKDLKAISPDAMDAVLRGCYDDEIGRMTVIDCRYPYEFEGGHIRGAVNLFTRDMVRDFLLSHMNDDATSGRHVLVFHCEFSSERGPKMYRHLRSEDRGLHTDVYPRLAFPEVYLLEGGYKAFFHKHMVQCEPQQYMPMLHKDHVTDLRHFRAKSKSWTAGERANRLRTSLRF